MTKSCLLNINSTLQDEKEGLNNDNKVLAPIFTINYTGKIQF